MVRRPQLGAAPCPLAVRRSTLMHTAAKSSVPTVGTVASGGQKGENMNKIVARILTDEDGLSTAEYAVGTVAAAGLGGVLIKLLTSTEVRDLLWSVLSNAFSSLFG